MKYVLINFRNGEKFESNDIKLLELINSYKYPSPIIPEPVISNRQIYPKSIIDSRIFEILSYYNKGYVW